MLMESTKQETGIISTDDTSNSKLSTRTTSSWSRYKDPRIVCISRAFGGKDRHSKVCTVRGLRDRRVRLSVPTALQLYDLQDKLGLNQPSKVVDWLLNAAKNGIDQLPPLQIPHGSFAKHLQHMLRSHELNANKSQSQCPTKAEDEIRDFKFNQALALDDQFQNTLFRLDSTVDIESDQGSSLHQLLLYQPAGLISQPYFSNPLDLQTASNPCPIFQFTSPPAGAVRSFPFAN